MATKNWKSWHEVVALKDELKSGELSLSMFAADLYEVLMQQGNRSIYENPEQFFALTYPTYSLRGLVRDVARRVAGKNDKAVRQLELTYGGGKTHALITLYHLMADPEKLPDLPAVEEFRQETGRAFPPARVAGLCFDKLDTETGMDVRGPDGQIRRLLQPWSVMAYQIAGDEGLKLMHKDRKAEEREAPPAENVLKELLEIPDKEGLGVLILIDEVLMYVRDKVGRDAKWADEMVYFFQCLTQAAVKVNNCCVVASLLASDFSEDADQDNKLRTRLSDIFTRQKEAPVEPVTKEDVAELLRRRFFTPDSIQDSAVFRAHVNAAVKNIAAHDEGIKKTIKDEENRFTQSYPFHPDLTEVFYNKWTQVPGFQRTRGVLRVFALALREAMKWDESPLIGPSVFLAARDQTSFAEATRELIAIADQGGSQQVWGGILEGELGRAKKIQEEMTGLSFREIEQAVIATFLHSQPTGQYAHLLDLRKLITSTGPDKINLEKALKEWTNVSYWLDDEFASRDGESLPGSWRLGNRPNLIQMHSAAVKQLDDGEIDHYLLNELPKTRRLSDGASASDVRVHTLPVHPQDINDDGQFRYAILTPDCACDSGNPSAKAKRFLDETTGSNKPRVYRNAVILLAPSRDGLKVVQAKIREHLAWNRVQRDLQDKKEGSELDLARMANLEANLRKSKAAIPDAIAQAYTIVVTVSDKNEAQAFKINPGSELHFLTIKNDDRARIKDAAISAESLLPEGPYDFWREGETFRLVKDLAGAFAQNPALPKMLKSKTITSTLVNGCAEGTFVMRLARPDGTARSWWCSRPDDNALSDPQLEVVLPEAATLLDIEPTLLVPEKLPGLWQKESITVGEIEAYFEGGKTVAVPRDGYEDQMIIPAASQETVFAAVSKAVEQGLLWLTSGPASVWAEPIPAGVLTSQAELQKPPAQISALEILSEALPHAWKGNETSPPAILSALSQGYGKNLPWKIVADVITNALNARYIEWDSSSAAWPCDYAAAGKVKFKQNQKANDVKEDGNKWNGVPASKAVAATASLAVFELQELAENVHKLGEITSKSDVPMTIDIRLEFGDSKTAPDQETIDALNEVLKQVNENLKLEP